MGSTPQLPGARCQLREATDLSDFDSRIGCLGNLSASTGLCASWSFWLELPFIRSQLEVRSGTILLSINHLIVLLCNYMDN